VWGLFGGLAGAWSPVRGALLATVGYAVLFGLMELFAPRPRVPGSSWQVPRGWVGQSRWSERVLVWGATLGPGLMTRNPLAGMWLLPLLLLQTGGVAAGLAAGAVAGAVHGGGRAVGVIRQIRAGADYDYYESTTRGFRWRYLDGVALLAAAGLFLTQMLAS
jgi:hypothetical protein